MTIAKDGTIRGLVLAHLLAGNSLTRLQCLRKFGTLKLPDIVFKIKPLNYPINMKMVEGMGKIPETGQPIKKRWGVWSIDKKWLEAQNGK